MLISADDKELFKTRSTLVDHEKVESLHYLGNLERRLPVSLSRMMENAYDWEHLPWIHSSSFANIALIEEGNWGWRAKAENPPLDSGEYVILELLVDRERDYWATSTVSGVGEGIQIHTQATRHTDHEIDIDVRFYMDEPPENTEVGQFVFETLRTLYTRLYDEDTELMSGRQMALDGRKKRSTLPRGEDAVTEYKVGAISDLAPETSHIIETPVARFCVRQWKGEWTVHSADCPHLLGPLEHAEISAEGTVTCPWHGYKFDVTTGKNLGNNCKSLAAAPALENRNGVLFLTIKDL